VTLINNFVDFNKISRGDFSILNILSKSAAISAIDGWMSSFSSIRGNPQTDATLFATIQNLPTLWSGFKTAVTAVTALTLVTP